MADTEIFERVRAEVAGYPIVDTPAIVTARAYGVDIGLLKESLALTPGERLQRNDEMLATLHRARLVGVSSG